MEIIVSQLRCTASRRPLLGREDEIQTFYHSVALGSKTSGLITYFVSGGGGVVVGSKFKFSILHFLDITITHSAPFTPWVWVEGPSHCPWNNPFRPSAPWLELSPPLTCLDWFVITSQGNILQYTVQPPVTLLPPGSGCRGLNASSSNITNCLIIYIFVAWIPSWLLKLTCHIETFSLLYNVH